MIIRTIRHRIEAELFKKKVIILYGARQVGKTTLVKEIQKKFKNSVYLNCDEPDIRSNLTDPTSTSLKSYIGKKKLVILDEAQRIPNIGLTLKLMVDTFPEVQVIATGSSSFELSNHVVEPLTGRAKEYHLYPFSIEELRQLYSPIELRRILEQRMVFGMYPEVVTSGADATDQLKHIARNYSYKDILQYQGIRNPEVLEKLLQALALQIGNEVSYNELATLVGVNRITIGSYIDILEKAFIIFRLRPLSRNPRKELAKMRKVYFFDVGIRNALINNLNPLSIRNDTGALWENYWMSERIKDNANNCRSTNMYFWRTYQQQEIDYVEESGGKLAAFECKLKEPKKKTPPSDWHNLYPKASYQIVTPANAFE